MAELIRDPGQLGLGAGGRPAVFLDRDGTINREVERLCRLADLQLLPGAVEGLRLLRRSGYLLVVVTNQSAVARGLLSEAELATIHSELQRQLAADSAAVDRIYYCPHHPDEGVPPYRRECSCRKPAPGMLHRAASELGIDLARSYMVGDSLPDMMAGWAAGCATVLVLTGYGLQIQEEADPDVLRRIDHVAVDLAAAAAWIAGRS